MSVVVVVVGVALVALVVYLVGKKTKAVIPPPATPGSLPNPTGGPKLQGAPNPP